MISVFYDGKCNLCSNEIGFYKKIAPKDVFNWLDITSSEKDLKLNNIKLVDALMYLHVKDCNDDFHQGVDAFKIIWSQLKYFKYLNYIVSLPIIYQLAVFIYDKFAKYRFKKLDHCQMALKIEKTKV
jgi:predicted DCC family thiol-disulfide oxidoreductase YuxK|tara:strand:+ start:11 stop:391 length:381 start_codon:yes stop_codon:yes gene_type:complete